MRSRPRASPSGEGGGGRGAGGPRRHRPASTSRAARACNIQQGRCHVWCRGACPCRLLTCPLPSHRRVASPKLVMEEAPESYKDVSEVVDTCHAAGISKKTVKLRPVAVVKG